MSGDREWRIDFFFFIFIYSGYALFILPNGYSLLYVLVVRGGEDCELGRGIEVFCFLVQLV